MFNNMIVTLPVCLQPVSLLSERQCKPARMDTNREHMTGGRMVTTRPTHVRLPPAQKMKQLESMEESDNSINNLLYQNQSNAKPVRVTGFTEQRTSLGPVTVTVPQGSLILSDSSAVGTLSDEQGRKFLVCPSSWIQFTLPQQQSNSLSTHSSQKSRRCSSSSSSSSAEELGDIQEPPRSPRDPHNPSHDRLVVHGGMSPPLPPRDKNCYQNIPVPGIIPIAKATCPSPQPTHTSQKKDLISLYSRLSGIDNEKDEERIRTSLNRLEDSGFFYESISAQEAKVKLRSCQVGTFLVRISSQSSHLFALSVKTNRGTTSIRIAYDKGSFRLDADPDCISKMPAFSCLVALIEYYVLQSGSDARNKCVFLESNGRRDTPVILTRPLREKLQSLKHICRRNIHYHLSKEGVSQFLENSSIPISIQTRQYIEKYPYAL